MMSRCNDEGQATNVLELQVLVKENHFSAVFSVQLKIIRLDQLAARISYSSDHAR